MGTTGCFKSSHAWREANRYDRYDAILLRHFIEDCQGRVKEEAFGTPSRLTLAERIIAQELVDGVCLLSERRLVWNAGLKIGQSSLGRGPLKHGESHGLLSRSQISGNVLPPDCVRPRAISCGSKTESASPFNTSRHAAAGRKCPTVWPASSQTSICSPKPRSFSRRLESNTTFVMSLSDV